MTTKDDWYTKAEKKIKKLQKVFSKRFEYIGSGRHRDVYFSKTKQFVFKIPNCIEGITSNDIEGSSTDNECAKAKLFYIKEIPIVIMELVKPLTNDELVKESKENDWIYSIDCQQVGYNRKHKVVAYDWGV